MANKKKPASTAKSRTAKTANKPLQQNAVNAAKPVSKPTAQKKRQVSKAAPKKQAVQGTAVNRSVKAQQEAPQAAPMTKGQKKAFNRAVKSRTKTGKKRGSRGGNYSLYYAFAAVVAVIVLVILANTVLFDCAAIVVEGNTAYTSEDISAASGISIGDNLLKADLEGAEQSIIAAFPYIDMAEVKRTSPTKVKITVTEAEKWYCVRHGSNVYVVSRRGKLVEQGNDPSLPVVIGFEALEPKVGTMLTSKIETKTAMPSQVLSAAETVGLTGITSLNMNDRFEMEMVVDNRITLKLGDSTQMENKMYVAKELVENEIGPTESVTIDLTNPEKVPVRDNNIIENQGIVPVAPSTQTAESSAEASDEA